MFKYFLITVDRDKNNEKNFTITRFNGICSLFKVKDLIEY